MSSLVELPLLAKVENFYFVFFFGIDYSLFPGLATMV